MGKTKHSKIALRVPTDCVAGKPRKDYQDNEKPKNKPGKMFFKHGVAGVIREDQGDGHKSGGRTKRLYSRILRKKLDQETMEIIDDQDIDNNE
jgi:hypothetical protein